MAAYDHNGLQSLLTATPQEGRELAILIARKTIAAIQPDADVRQRLRPDYADDTAKLMQAGQIVAIEFQTIAAANDYWRGEAELVSVLAPEGLYNGSPGSSAKRELPRGLDLVGIVYWSGAARDAIRG